MPKASFCYVTCATRDEALRLARQAVQERLAASANIVGETVSVYRWAGELHEKPEATLVLKTVPELAGRLVERLRELHSYECPAIVVLPVTDGDPAYLNWIEAETLDREPQP